jgi:hypothetical protein
MPAKTPTKANESTSRDELVMDVAKDIFAKIYMDTSGRKPAYMAERAFEAAAAFAAMADEYKAP